MEMVVHSSSILKLLSVKCASLSAVRPQESLVAFVLIGLSWLWLEHPGRRDPWLLCSVHSAVFGVTFLGGYRAMVVVVYLSSIPSLFPVELAIGRTIDPA